MNEVELRKKAIEKSTEKWSKLSLGLKANPECGFCWYVCKKLHKTDFTNKSCEKYCPLFPDICSNEHINDNQLFWKHERYDNTLHEKKLLAKEMLNVIKKRGEKWIKKITN